MAEDKKAINLKKLKSLNPDKLRSLNVNTGKQSSPTNVKKRTMLGAGVSGPYGERLRSLGKILNRYGTNNPDNKFLKAIRNSKDPGLGKKDSFYTMKKVLGPSLGMKKGGKVKKAKGRDGIAQRGKTRGRMR